jgi:hypothetical protein
MIFYDLIATMIVIVVLSRSFGQKWITITCELTVALVCRIIGAFIAGRRSGYARPLAARVF